MADIEVNVNGNNHSLDIDPNTPLLWVLREHLKLVGAKYGCGISQCGACTVLVNGMAMRSCQLPISAVGNQPVTTIEGLSKDGSHPLQEAWLDLDVAQCGYCQPGQIMSAAALLNSNVNPSSEAIEATMSGNICRCGTYLRIKKAIRRASTQMMREKL